MTKYVLAYSGGAGMAATDEERQQLMAAWGAWLGGLGTALADPGNPFAASKSVAPDGSVSDGGVAGISGYSIVNADSLDDAVALVDGCPALAAGGRTDVYEAIEISM